MSGRLAWLARAISGAPERRLEATWRATMRVDVTLSLPDPRGAEMAARAAANALDADGRGYTLSGPHVGAWEGRREVAYTLSLVGDRADRAAETAALAAIAAGCEAIQCETFGRSPAEPYEVREVRRI